MRRHVDDAEGRRAADHVVVREDLSRARDDHSGARGAAVPV